MSGTFPSTTGDPHDRPDLARDGSSRMTDGTNAQTVRVKLGPSIAIDDGSTRERTIAPKLLTHLLPTVPGYDLIEELGTGGNGVVYKAKHISLGRIVALKTHFSGAFVDPDHLNRLQNEAQALAKLQHPNIVQIYEVGDDGGRPYLALEYCRGGPLSRQLDGKPWEPKSAAELVATLADAVQAAHTAGVIHRDLKPGNILLQFDEARAASTRLTANDAPVKRKINTAADHQKVPATPKISDFGLARPCDAPTGMTTAGVALGTPSYMPPEQARGELDQLGPLVDVYALGAILYELLTGRPPFLGHNDYETLHQVVHQEPVSPRTWIPDLPRDLETICLKCLQKNPVARYATARDLADDLTRFVNGEPVLARPIGVVTRAGRWARRRPAAAGLVAVSLLAFVLAIGLAGVMSYWLHASERQRVESERLRIAALAAEARSEKLRERAEQAAKQTRDALDDMLSEQALSWLATQSELLPQQREFLTRALKYYEQMATADDAPEAHFTYAMANFRVARILDALNRTQESVLAYAKAVEVMEKLVEQHPDDMRFANVLAKCLINRGIMLKMTFQFPEAESHFRRGVELAEKCSTRMPQSREYRVDFGKGLLSLAGLLFDTNRPQGVENLIHQGIDVFAQVCAQDASDTDASECLAHCYTVMSKCDRLAWRLADGEKNCQKSIAIFETLAQQYPRTASYRHLLADRWNALSDFTANLGKLAESESAARRAVELYENLVREFPTAYGQRLLLAGSLNNLGIALYYRGQYPEAEKHYRRALELRSTVSKDRTTTINEQAAVGSLHVNLALLSDQTGRRAAAENHYRQAVAIRDAICRDPRATDGNRLELAQSLSALANLVFNSASLAESEQLYRRAGALFQQLLERNPDHADARMFYGGHCCNFGNLMQHLGEHDAAVDKYTQGIGILKPLLDQEGRRQDARIYLSNTYLGRGATFRLLQRPAEALTDFDECERLDPSEIKKTKVRRFRAATLVAGGELERAIQLANEMAAQHPAEEEDLLAAARTWALLAQHQGEAAGKKSVELLRRAFQMMARPNLGVLAQNEFDHVRDRGDFQALKSEFSKDG